MWDECDWFMALDGCFMMFMMCDGRIYVDMNTILFLLCTFLCMLCLVVLRCWFFPKDNRRPASVSLLIDLCSPAMAICCLVPMILGLAGASVYLATPLIAVIGQCGAHAFFCFRVTLKL